MDAEPDSEAVSKALPDSARPGGAPTSQDSGSPDADWELDEHGHVQLLFLARLSLGQKDRLGAVRLELSAAAGDLGQSRAVQFAVSPAQARQVARALSRLADQIDHAGQGGGRDYVGGLIREA